MDFSWKVFHSCGKRASPKCHFTAPPGDRSFSPGDLGDKTLSPVKSGHAEDEDVTFDCLRQDKHTTKPTVMKMSHSPLEDILSSKCNTLASVSDTAKLLALQLFFLNLSSDYWEAHRYLLSVPFNCPHWEQLPILLHFWNQDSSCLNRRISIIKLNHVL